MRCDECERVLDSWIAGVECEKERGKALLDHLESCERCASRWSALLPLLRRDFAEGRPAVPSAAAAALADSVMSRITAGEATGGAASRPMPRRAVVSKSQSFWSRAIPAAAAAVLIVGLVLGAVWIGRDRDLVTVRFVLSAPEARSVALAGDFTGWKIENLRQSRAAGGGTWVLTLNLRRGSLYAYNFIVDGERWIPDPAVPERIEDGFGGSSSLLRL